MDCFGQTIFDGFPRKDALVCNLRLIALASIPWVYGIIKFSSDNEKGKSFLKHFFGAAVISWSCYYLIVTLQGETNEYGRVLNEFIAIATGSFAFFIGGLLTNHELKSRGTDKK